MDRPLNRIDPKMDPQFYKTYQITSPIETHYRDATCQEVECQHHLAGWKTTVDVSTVLGAKQANYIRLLSGRKFTFTEEGSIVTFYFPGGQKCFSQHKAPLGRPEFFIVREGDWRGNPRRTDPIQRNANDWVDDFANHQDKLNDKFQEG